MGLSAHLLKDATENAFKVADLTRAKALIIDPAAENAAAFYEHFGFTRLTGTNRMASKL